MKQLSAASGAGMGGVGSRVSLQPITLEDAIIVLIIGIFFSAVAYWAIRVAGKDYWGK